MKKNALRARERSNRNWRGFVSYWCGSSGALWIVESEPSLRRNPRGR